MAIMPSIVTLTVNPAIDVSTSVGKVEPVRKLRCKVARRDPGGGGINVARVLQRLGADVTAIFPTGGATGELLRRLVEKEGVRSITVHTEEETRESFTVFDESSGDQFRFVLPGPSLSEPEWRGCLDAFKRVDGPLSYIVASGSLPQGAPDDFYAQLIRMGKERGAKIVLDASGRGLRAGLQEGVFLVKPSLRELQELLDEKLPTEADWTRAAQTLVSKGWAQAVALTLGHEGAVLTTAQGSMRAEAPAIEAMSAVGAGDSFLGAMVWSLAEGAPLAEALRYGVAGGSAAVLNPGTELCSARDVHRLYDQVKVSAIGAAATAPRRPDRSHPSHRDGQLRRRRAD
jgi:6-phosphofructokinase 2